MYTCFQIRDMSRPYPLDTGDPGDFTGDASSHEARTLRAPQLSEGDGGDVSASVVRYRVAEADSCAQSRGEAGPTCTDVVHGPEVLQSMAHGPGDSEGDKVVSGVCVEGTGGQSQSSSSSLLGAGGNPSR